MDRKHNIWIFRSQTWQFNKVRVTLLLNMSSSPLSDEHFDNVCFLSFRLISRGWHLTFLLYPRLIRPLGLDYCLKLTILFNKVAVCLTPLSHRFWRFIYFKYHIFTTRKLVPCKHVLFAKHLKALLSKPLIILYSFISWLKLVRPASCKLTTILCFKAALKYTLGK